jgi:hypothetical protein
MKLLAGFIAVCVIAMLPVLVQAGIPPGWEADPRADYTGDGQLNSADQLALAYGITLGAEFPPNPCVERRQYAPGDTLINPWDGSAMTPNASSYYTLIPDDHPWLPALRAGTPVAWRYCP